MKSIIANNTDAAGFADGSKTGFIVPLKHGIDISGMIFAKIETHKQENIGTQAYFCKHDEPNEWWGVKSPYTIGQEVAVREAWYAGGFWQEQQLNESVNFREDDGYFWTKERVLTIPENPQMQYIRRSQASMPKELTRTIIIPTSVKCVRVRELTQQDVNKIGVDSLSEFIKKVKITDYVFFYECKTK